MNYSFLKVISESCNLSFNLGNQDTINIAITTEEKAIQFTVSGIIEKQVRENDTFNLSAMIIESLADTFEYGEDYLFISKEIDNWDE